MKVFAHRGASGEYPENTLLAFRQALLQECDGIELDIHYHPSGEFIVIHNGYINNALQQATRIQDLTLAELLSLPADKTEKLITLKDALTCISGQCQLNIEIKTTHLALAEIPQLLKALITELENNIVAGLFLREQLVISSFNHHVIKQLKDNYPSFHTAALIASCPINFAKFTDQLSVSGLNLAFDCANQELIDDAHQRGLVVGVYTVNHPADIKQCQQWGVDFVFSDFPARTKNYLT